MSFGLIIFMRRTSRGHSIFVFAVFSFNLFVRGSFQTQQDNAVSFSGDFESFIKELGSKVYKAQDVEETKRSKQTYHTTTNKNIRKTENVLNTQKEALGDVLMMKLVSYYEDKYKLAHYDQRTTTERITIMKTYPPYVNKYNEVDANRNIFSDIDSYSHRRMRNERRYTTRKSQDDLPEVVIL
ncbi:uncharacterized protein LOC142974139 isoform X2 [Anticarsia gemmatalis]|uniref:uncharacterized protein LOC142974139 isoform X2 n=1 Tax=Anticarsia gemmatalis TaxID=129554 RepID=UPI003F76CE5C